MIVLNDIAYGTHERQKADIFIPEKVKALSGLILYVHGGGWTAGDKTIHHPDAEHFCNLGYICASINYRYVTDEISVFDELDDITAALGTIKSALWQRGYFAEKMIISGGSAGGHLSLMYAYTRKDEAPITPVAACVYCPPVNCSNPNFLMGLSSEFEEWKNGLLSNCCGILINKENFMNAEQQNALKNISPIMYVNENCVPTAVFQGKLDELVPYDDVMKFIKILNENNIKNNLVIYENSGHTLDKDPEAVTESKNIIQNYCEKYF